MPGPDVPNRFSDRLRTAQSLSTSRLCVGLDPVVSRLPAPFRSMPTVEGVRRFCEAIVEATAHAACAFKPNLAFFEALGPAGLEALAHVVEAIPEGRLVIADAKRGDIGNTARAYAKAYFETMQSDAVTVSAYMGRDAVDPFLAYPSRAAFVLVRTSNPGGSDFQELIVDGRPLYLHVAEQSASWGEAAAGEVGFVVGATQPEALAEIRRLHPRVPFLIPGVGAQGGSASAVIEAAATNEGLVLVNSSRGILYASAGPDFAEAAAQEAERLRLALG